MNFVPDWLIKRARDGDFSRAFTLLEPKTEHGAAVYLLEGRDQWELHAVEDATSGVDGFTTPLSRGEMTLFLGRLAGSLGGRIHGMQIPPIEAPIPVVPS